MARSISRNSQVLYLVSRVGQEAISLELNPQIIQIILTVFFVCFFFQAKRKDKNVVFVVFVALRPKSTAVVMAGLSVHHNHTFSWASLNKQLTSTSCTYFSL